MGALMQRTRKSSLARAHGEPSQEYAQRIIFRPLEEGESLSKLPNGLEDQAYLGWEDWSGSRWAWEFLRRNSEYRRHCADALDEEATSSSMKASALEFGLKDLKQWDEPFDAGTKPRFTDRVKSWPSIETFKEENTATTTVTKQKAPRAGVAQVLIRFDVRQMALGDSCITGQLDSAERQLKKYVKAYREGKGLGTGRSRLRKPKPEKLLLYLRAFDMVAAGSTRAEVCAALLPPSRDRGDAKKKTDSGRELVDTARLYVGADYLLLAQAKKLPPARREATKS
jgi:hypothetical protein